MEQDNSHGDTGGSTPSPNTPSCLVGGRDDDRNASTVHHGSADRTEQHSGESATAVATDDDQLGRLGQVEKTAGRLIPNHHPFDADVGVAVLPAGDALARGSSAAAC